MLERTPMTGDGDRRRLSAPDGLVRELARSAAERFERSRMILSFQELLGDVLARPRLHVRSAAVYLHDAIEHFGWEERTVLGEKVRRYRIFEDPTGGGASAVMGQERAHTDLVKRLKALADKGRADKLVMVHGPNGSAKSSTVECLARGLEAYSRTDEGALYRYGFVFAEALERENLGFAKEGRKERAAESYAYLAPDDITARILCDLKDNPLLLIPKEERAVFLRRAFEGHGLDPKAIPAAILEGDLSQKGRDIFDTLLAVYQGDWLKVVQHVQVERFFISRRYRCGFVSIEPQRNVDASTRALHGDSRHDLPAVLQGITLYEAAGDLIDGNRGLVEYSDFFKRPLEVNKYLLTTIEKNTVSLANQMAYLDLVLMATANEKNLCLARRDPDFGSFKGRFELCRMPYLLEVSKEERIYAAFLAAAAREKPVAPHTARIAALWAVLTRLKRPRAKSYAGALGAIVTRLTPMEKARLYDDGTPPGHLDDQEKRELLAALPKIAREYDDAEEELEGVLDAGYEGRRGISPREMAAVLAEAANDPAFPTLSPQAVLHALRELVKDVAIHDFLRLSPQGGYHDAPKLVDDCEREYRRLIEEDIRAALELVSEEQYGRMLDEYLSHVRAATRGERVRSAQTGELEPPDETLMDRIERAVPVTGPRDAFRSRLVTRIAVFSIDHPGKKLDTSVVFADLLAAIKADFYRTKEELVRQRIRHVLMHGTEDAALLDAAQKKAVEATLSRLAKLGYDVRCAKEMLSYALRERVESA